MISNQELQLRCNLRVGIYCQIYVQQYGTYLANATTAPSDLFNKTTGQIQHSL
jgi:hypothetical protein